MYRHNVVRICLVLTAVVLWQGPTLAQTVDLEPNVFGSAAFPSLPVDILPPGARALGLAGAFGAVADDATAAEANPAGLTILSQAELSIHLRDTDYSVPFVDPEALDPALFGPATSPLIKEYEDSVTNVSFASFVKPFERWVVSGFYTNQLDLQGSTLETITDTVNLDVFGNSNTLEAQVEGYGLAGAFRVTDNISIGLTIKRVELDLFASETESIDDFNDLEFIFGDPMLGLGTPAEFAAVIDDRISASTSLSGDDHDTVFNLGILFNPNGFWSAGLIYKEGGSFDIPGVITQQQVLRCTGSGPQTDICNAVFDSVNMQTGGLIDMLNRTNTIPSEQRVKIPDQLTLGLALRPTDTFLMSADINRIEYSELPGPRLNSLGLRQPVDGEALDDKITFHVGLEKVFPLSGTFMNVFTVRAGVFEEHDHDGYRVLDSDNTHYTFGLGAVFNRLQLDFAYENGDAVENLVLSGIFRFQ